MDWTGLDWSLNGLTIRAPNGANNNHDGDHDNDDHDYGDEDEDDDILVSPDMNVFWLREAAEKLAWEISCYLLVMVMMIIWDNLRLSL